MNILFLTLSPNLTPKDGDGIYSSILYELTKDNSVYIVSPLQRREKKNSFVETGKNFKTLNVKVGNITKCNIIEKGISTLLIQKQFKNAIKRYFNDVKFDIILYSTPPITFCSVIKYFKKRDSAKTYLMLKDIFPQNAVDMKMFSKKSIIYKYFRKQEINLYKISDKIGCMSPKNKEFLLNNNDFLDNNKVEVFPNSINSKKDNLRNLKLNDKFRRKYNIPSNSRVFMYGGNLGKPQGIPFIIDCLKEIKNMSNTFFVVCGTGTEYKKLEEFKNNEKLENLLLLNGLPKKEYTDFLNIADVGLIFLDYNFTIPNFPSRLLSYMEKGIPILSCTDPNTDIGDIIEKNGFGWKTLSNDACNFSEIVQMISDLPMDTICDMGAKAREYLQKKYLSSKNYKRLLGEEKTDEDSCC